MLASNEVDRIKEAANLIKNEYKSLDEKPSYKSGTAKALMLPLSNNIKLYTVCRKPIGNGPFPTIVMRSCYPDQETLYAIHAEEFCKRGFAYVYQFCRGIGKSEGEWAPNIHDRQDGIETLNWLSGQKWVENIGYWGCSYLAFTGWILADIVPDKVKTLYLTHYGTDRFTSAYQNGLFRQDVLTAWAMGNAGFDVTADYTQSVRFRPQVNVDEKFWGRKIDWYREWITNTNRDDPYWSQGFWQQLKEIPSKVKIPVYIGEGWFDHHLGSALKTYEWLSPESKAHSVMRIGAWNHNFGSCVQGLKCDHLENSDIVSAFSWFDTILRKKDLPEGKVRTYQIGADRWQEDPVFPFPVEKIRKFYFDTSEKENKAFFLIGTPGKTKSSASYVYDPDNPVVTHGAESVLATFNEIGSLRQFECGWRDDVVSFVSEPLSENLDILGKIQVKLWVSSTAEDTAFTAKLIEIHSNGNAYNFRSGITTLAYRRGTGFKRMKYTPGYAVEAVIDLWDISWRLHKGSRLRVDISSSDTPQYAIHTNYAGIWSLQDKAKTARQTLYTGVEMPSQIILPLRS